MRLIASQVSNRIALIVICSTDFFGVQPTLFDAVEFSDEIASGDVLYDLAFLLMDLEERGLRAAANWLFNPYLAPEPPEALTGLVALPLFLSLNRGSWQRFCAPLSGSTNICEGKMI